MSNKKPVPFNVIAVEKDLDEANHLLLNMSVALHKYFGENSYGGDNRKRIKFWHNKINIYMENHGVDLLEVERRSL
jgi:hypothetical protein